MTNYPKHPNLFWLTVFILGWLFDFLFWEQATGVNFALFAMASLLAGFGLLIFSGFRPNSKSLWLLIPFTFFTLVTIFRKEPLTAGLAYTFSLISLGTMANTYMGGRWVEYILPDYVSKFLLLIFSAFTNLGGFLSYIRTQQTDNEKIPIGAILRGLGIALPVVFFFGNLLTSADLVFEQKIHELFDLLNINDTGEFILRSFLILVYTFQLAGLFLHIFLWSNDKILIGEHKPIIRPFLGFIESTVITGSVSILFSIFVIIQFRYFFGGQTNIGIEGYTYSQYARRGFTELNVVAFFSLLLILGLSILTQLETERQRKLNVILNIIMVSFVIVMLVSSYQRLALAIGWHGYSRLRLYPRLFMPWLGILLIAVIILQALKKERYFTFTFLIASFGFSASLALLNIDRAIIIHNIPRYLQGKNLNVGHLSSLSTDAIPTLTEEFQNPSYPDELHEGIGAILLCYANTDSIMDTLSQNDWRSFNFSNWRAQTILRDFQTQLTDYEIMKKRDQVIVRTPGKDKYECGKYLGDF